MNLDPIAILEQPNPEFRTICEVLREIYDLAEEPEIRSRCEEAIVMAKKMDARLRHYKYNYDEGWWEPKT